MLKTLRARLIAGYIVVVVLSLVLAGGVFILLVQRVESDAVYRSLETNGNLLMPQIRDALRGDNRGRVIATLKTELTRTKLRVLVLGPAGRVLNDTDGLADAPGEVLRLTADSTAGATPEQGTFLDPGNGRWNYIIMTPPRQADPAAKPPVPGSDADIVAQGTLTWVLAQRPPQLSEVWAGPKPALDHVRDHHGADGAVLRPDDRGPLQHVPLPRARHGATDRDVPVPRADGAVAAQDRPAVRRLYHTTVMHADKKIRQLMAERRAIYNQVTELTNRIKQPVPLTAWGAAPPRGTPQAPYGGQQRVLRLP